MSNPNTSTPMCADCNALVGASLNAKPHANLQYKEGRQGSSMMGAADEAYCSGTVCGHEWLHETGSCGVGWLA